MTATATAPTEVDRIGLELKEARAEMEALVETATPKNRKERHATIDRVDELKADLRRAAKDADKVQKAIVKAKGKEDTDALVSGGEGVLEIVDSMRKNADALADGFAKLRPLLREFASRAHTVGITLPPRFVSGSFLHWELEAVLYRCWPKLFTRPRAPQLFQNNLGDLVRRSVATAVEAARRTLSEEGTP